MGWGGGYQEEPVGPILDAISEASKIPFDRWKVKMGQKEMIMNNYFSIGVDAKIALAFHEEREKNPSKFKSRTKNKMKYGLIGMKQSYKEVRTKLELSKLLVCELDGHPLELPSSAQALIITNLPSYSGGASVWGKSDKDKFSPQSINDTLFEVCTVSGTAHMSRIVGKMSSADRVGQGRALTIRLLEALPVQLDGEPSLQEPCTITITHNGQCNVYISPKAKVKVDTDKPTHGQSFALMPISELATLRPLPHSSWTVSNFQAFYAAVPNPRQELNRASFIAQLEAAGFEAVTSAADWIYTAIDQDGTGFLSVASLSACLLTVCEGPLQPKLDTTFRVYDVDNSGDIDRWEFSNMLYTVSLLTYDESKDLHAVIRLLTNETFALFNTAKDGRLSKADFETACSTNRDILFFYELGLANKFKMLQKPSVQVLPTDRKPTADEYKAFMRSQYALQQWENSKSLQEADEQEPAKSLAHLPQNKQSTIVAQPQ